MLPINVLYVLDTKQSVVWIIFPYSRSKGAFAVDGLTARFNKLYYFSELLVVDLLGTRGFSRNKIS